MQNYYATMIGIGAQAIGLACMAGFAAISPTVWALMAGMLMISVALLVASHIIYPGPRMAFVWDREISGRLWNYGKYLMGSSALTFLARNVDKLMLAGFLGAASFGVYSIALVWIDAGRTLLMRVANRAGFPAIAELIRSKPDQMPRRFRKYQTVMDTVCLTAFLGTFLLGEALIRFLYTDTYADAGRFLQLLSVSFLATRFRTLTMLLMNIGDSRAMMISSGIQAAFICISLPLAFNAFGLPAVLLATAMTPMASAPYVIAKLYPVLGAKQTRIDITIVLFTLLMGGVVYAVA